MDVDTYYRDHWVDIEPARLDRYREQFRIGDGSRPLLVDPLGVRPGESVLDFGCGPGYLSIELARIVGREGRIHAVDLNPDLLAMARDNAESAGVVDRIDFHLLDPAAVDRGTVPLDDGVLDRAVFKSVLLYVPDVDAVLADTHRTLRPGGHLATQDTDFWLSACPVFTRDEWREFLDAIVPAFRDPTMGRNLPAALRRAGFDNVSTRVDAMVDQRGGFRPMMTNMLGYLRQVGGLPPGRLEDMEARADRAVAEGDWLMVMNLFQVGGTKR